MKFTVVELDGEEKVIYRKKPEKDTLGELFEGHIKDIRAISVNDKFLNDWQDYRFDKKDNITIYPNAGDPFTAILVNILISVALSFLASLLTPKPKKPSAFKSQPSTGVAGIQNTIAPGTPKFLVYGLRRVAGHIIGSQVDLVDPVRGDASTGRKMDFKVLYFMGVGQVCCISDVKINNTHIEDLEGPPETYTRLGTQDQTIIPGWKFCHQTYHDGREIELPLRPSESKREFAPDGEPIVYTTKGPNVNKVTFFYHFPAGIWSIGVHGASYADQVTLKIFRKKNSQPEGYWTDLGEFKTLRVQEHDGFFWKVELDCPDADRWDFKMYSITNDHGSFGSGPSMQLYNIMETMFIETAYPGSALLEVHGIGNSQITGFDQMETTALEEGRLVGVPNNGIFTPQCSRNRVWIVRDIMLNREVALGNRIDPELWNLAPSVAAAAYYEEDVTGFDGVTAQRDFCDVILNEIRPGWDWVKILLFEGRASLVPAGGKWTYMLDVDKTQSLLYSSPGNIIEETLQYQRGSGEKAINTVKGEFPDEENEFKVVPTKLVSTTRGTDPERVEDVSYISLVRKSQVGREMNFLLKKRLLVNKRWNWSAPRSAIISQPYDVDWLAYRTSKNLRGYTGLIDGGATTTRIPIGKSVFLTAGLTYSVHIRQENTVEERNLTNATGQTYSVLTFATPLSFTPQTGDIWAVGSSIEHKVKIQIEETEFDGENFKVVAHEHIPDVYDDSLFALDNTGIRDITELQNGAIAITNPPSPLLKAQVGLTVQSGITVSVFSVVPSYNSLSGVYTSIPDTNTIILASSEPDLDDFFNDTYITADGEGPLHVLAYIGSSRAAVVEAPGFLSASTSSGIYTINWQGYSPYYGFHVAGATSSAGPFSTTGVIPVSIEGDTELISNSAAGTYSYYRFTPFNAELEENLNARWVVGVGITDTTAPLPPVYVDMSSNDIQAVASFRLVAPVERDLHTASISFYQNSPLSGTLLDTNDVDISRFRDDSATIREGATDSDLESNTYGDSIFAKVSTTDFFGNESRSAISILGTTLSSTINNDYGSIDIDDERTKRTLTGTGVNAVCAMTVFGGTITPPTEAVRVDSLITITGGSSSSISFGYSFGGVTISTLTPVLAGGISDSPYWLTCIIEPITLNQQTARVFGYGEETIGDNLRTDSASLTTDSNNDAILAISSQASASGIALTVHRTILRNITFSNNTIIPDADIVPFTPGLTQNWGITPPTNVGDALDDLADQISDLADTVAGLTFSPGGSGTETRRIPINLRNPQGTSNAGNAFYNVVALTNVDIGEWQFVKDVDGSINGTVPIPPNLAATPAAKIILVIGANATSGVTRLNTHTKSVADDTESYNVTLTADTAQDITVPATSRLTKKVTFTAGDLSNIVARDILFVNIQHAGAHANDTLAVNTELIDAYLEVDLEL